MTHETNRVVVILTPLKATNICAMLKWYKEALELNITTRNPPIQNAYDDLDFDCIADFQVQIAAAATNGFTDADVLQEQADYNKAYRLKQENEAKNN